MLSVCAELREPVAHHRSDGRELTTDADEPVGLAAEKLDRTLDLRVPRRRRTRAEVDRGQARAVCVADRRELAADHDLPALRLEQHRVHRTSDVRVPRGRSTALRVDRGEAAPRLAADRGELTCDVDRRAGRGDTDRGNRAIAIGAPFAD